MKKNLFLLTLLISAININLLPQSKEQTESNNPVFGKRYPHLCTKRSTCSDKEQADRQRRQSVEYEEYI